MGGLPLFLNQLRLTDVQSMRRSELLRVGEQGQHSMMHSGQVRTMCSYSRMVAMWFVDQMGESTSLNQTDNY